MPGCCFIDPNDTREDDGADRRRQRALERPIPQPCHQCGHAYAGCICPLCKEERPAYTALKSA